MPGSLSRALCLAMCAVLLAAMPAAASGGVRKRGDCSGGEGGWELRVDRVDRDTLRIRFRIDDVDAGETWQLFISDNGTRVYSGTKRATSDGEVRIRRAIRDRAGTDKVAASGVNVNDGTTCQGSVAF
ncbi:MAG TPA: hypothetical protein VLA82_10555 [Actinomycetota bacterium]|nr:hypothetical protein [Actinomycetota bacterium]